MLVKIVQFLIVHIITTVDEGVFRSNAIMALIGNIGEFIDSQESWTQYTERLEQFFVANDIVEDKKAAVLLAIIGPVAFRVSGNLVAPDKPCEVVWIHLQLEYWDLHQPFQLLCGCHRNRCILEMFLYQNVHHLHWLLPEAVA